MSVSAKPTTGVEAEAARRRWSATGFLLQGAQAPRLALERARGVQGSPCRVQGAERNAEGRVSPARARSFETLATRRAKFIRHSVAEK